MTVIAASVGVAVATATGVTYASSALESAPTKSAAITKDAAPAPPRGGNGTGTDAGSNAASDAGSSHSWGSGSKREEGRGESRGQGRDHGQIMINERTYAAEPGSCIVVVNVNPALLPGTAATSFNIRNESDKTVEFFSGITCDNGAPIATVGPHSSTNAITGQQQTPGLIVGSFRVIDNTTKSDHR